jgi:hypothetical protein
MRYSSKEVYVVCSGTWAGKHQRTPTADFTRGDRFLVTAHTGNYGGPGYFGLALVHEAPGLASWASMAGEVQRAFVTLQRRGEMHRLFFGHVYSGWLNLAFEYWDASKQWDQSVIEYVWYLDVTLSQDDINSRLKYIEGAPVTVTVDCALPALIRLEVFRFLRGSQAWLSPSVGSALKTACLQAVCFGDGGTCSSCGGVCRD